MHAEAAELYRLENQRPFTSEQMQRWQQLAHVVFARTIDDKRASARLSAKAQVRIGEHVRDVIDVSWGGLRLAGALPAGDEIEVSEVCLGGQWQAVRIACRVLRGTTLRLAELDARHRHDYFVRLYYPIYLEHLRGLAVGFLKQADLT